jgi:hypothetical protein
MVVLGGATPETGRLDSVDLSVSGVALTHGRAGRATVRFAFAGGRGAGLDRRRGGEQARRREHPPRLHPRVSAGSLSMSC